MNYFKIIFIGSFFLFYNLNAQKKFNVKVRFSSQLNTNNLSINYDDGKRKNIETKLYFKNNEVSISGTYYARYATINLNYREDKMGFSKSFWVENKPATITINTDSSRNPLKNIVLKNAYSLESMGEEKYYTYCSAEIKDFFDFIIQTNGKMNDSLANIAYIKSTAKYKKTIEFIKNNNSLYYSFWLFKNNIIADYYENPDTLTTMYETFFPDSLKNSFEGKEIVKYLNGRRLSTNDDYIDFAVKDVKGKLISLSNSHSKYVLLTFWASWCGPCLKELPVIKKIRMLYSNNDLEIISVNWDKSFIDFEKTAKNHNMNWTHIFDNNDINSLYGIVAIPTIFLIDINNKKIIYSSKSNIDKNLDFLTQLLAEKL